MTTTISNLTTIRRTLALAGALTALAVSTSSIAAPHADGAPSVQVRYDDLNLSSDEGTNTLYQRISSAARQVCPDVYSRDLDFVAASRRCQADAIARAVRDLHNPQLAAIHAAHLSHG